MQRIRKMRKSVEATTESAIPMKNSIFMILGEAIPLHFESGYGGINYDFVGRASISLFFFLFFTFYSQVEFIGKKKMLTSLRRFEEDIKGIKEETFDKVENISDENIGKEATKTLASIDDALFELLDETKKAVSLNTIAYLVPAGKGDVLRVREASSEDERFYFDSEVNLEFYREVMRSKKPLLLSRAKGLHGLEPGYYKDVPSRINSFAAVPVMGKNQIEGILVADRRNDKKISENELSFLNLVAIMVRDIQSSRINLSKLTLNLKELEELYGISRNLASAGKLGDIFVIVFRAVSNMLPTRLMAFSMVTGSENVLISVRGEDEKRLTKKRFDASESLVGWVLENRKYLVFPDKRGKKDVFGKDLKIKSDGALLIFPLISEDVLIGTFVLITESLLPPSRLYIRIIEVILNMSAVSINGIRLMSKIRRLAITDPMTGLYNRRRFNRALNEQFDRAERFSEELTLLMIDIDRFKAINDMYGHPVGDEVIKGVSDIIKGVTRGVDVVSRIGGEEFAILLPKTSKNNAMITAERIRRAVKKKGFGFKKKGHTVTVSIGVATFPKDGNDPETLLKKADNALYLAKDGGRDRCVAN